MIKFHIVSPCEECPPELLQVAKGFCSVHTEHVARRLALLVAVAANDQFTIKCSAITNASSSPYNVEVVSGWFRTNPHSREVLLQQIPDSNVMDRQRLLTQFEGQITDQRTCHEVE